MRAQTSRSRARDRVGVTREQRKLNIARPRGIGAFVGSRNFRLSSPAMLENRIKFEFYAEINVVVFTLEMRVRRDSFAAALACVRARLARRNIFMRFLTFFIFTTTFFVTGQNLFFSLFIYYFFAFFSDKASWNYF